MSQHSLKRSLHCFRQSWTCVSGRWRAVICVPAGVTQSGSPFGSRVWDVSLSIYRDKKGSIKWYWCDMVCGERGSMYGSDVCVLIRT